MKTGAIVNVYNEIEWIDTTLSCIVDHFDEVVITEGAYKMAMNVGAAPRSSDGTLEVLEKYAQRKNVTVLHENEQDQANQLNKGLAVLKAKGVDWMMVVDADEVWESKSLTMIKRYMESGDKSGIYQYRVHFYNFTNSFDQCSDADMKRVFKITPGCRFNYGNENMEWPDHGKFVDSGQKAAHLGFIPPVCKGFHYTEIKNKNRWLLKKEYLINKDNNPRFHKWHIDENGFHHDEMHLVKPFTGKHPEKVQQHELYKLWQENKLKDKLFG